MVSLRSQRRLASQILKVGQNRIWIDPERVDEVEAAITREEIRKLIHEGAIKALPKGGISRVRARILQKKKRKGLRRGSGSRSGAAGSRTSKKDAWMIRVRALRRKLRELKASRAIAEGTYRKLYVMVKSGRFASTADMERYLMVHGLWRKR